eukprot:m.261095 g.261095  ORF g.261095 m.261095 type:complete len:378 (+) comp15574_c0_seq1:59-1192(+)
MSIKYYLFFEIIINFTALRNVNASEINSADCNQTDLNLLCYSTCILPPSTLTSLTAFCCHFTPYHPLLSINLQDNDTIRCEKVLDNAEKMNCRKFVDVPNILSGNQKLNMAFVALLFNTYPGLESKEGFDPSSVSDEDAIVETREEKTFRNWMNSLGIQPYVHNFYVDLGDGWVLLQLCDMVRPGIVDWARVNKPPFKKFGGKMKKIENCNYAVQLGNELNMSMVGIGGPDIHNGIKKLVLGFAWQLMRAYTIRMLQQLSGSDAPVSDDEVIGRVNARLSKVGKQTVAGLRDGYISTSQPILDLLNLVKKNCVQKQLVIAGETDEIKLLNARYAISLARKVGVGVYALPEDIVELNGKMLLTIFAVIEGKLMQLDSM